MTSPEAPEPADLSRLEELRESVTRHGKADTQQPASAELDDRIGAISKYLARPDVRDCSIDWFRVLEVPVPIPPSARTHLDNRSVGPS
jgi:hypothetical protein